MLIIQAVLSHLSISFFVIQHSYTDNVNYTTQKASFLRLWMDLWPSGMIMLTKHEYTPTITGMLSSTNKHHNIIMKSTKVQTLNAVIRHNSDMSWLCNYSACMPSLKMQPTVHRETLSAELLKYAFFDETTSLARPSYRNYTHVHTRQLPHACNFYRKLNCIGLA